MFHGPALSLGPNNAVNYGRRQFKNFACGNTTTEVELTLASDPSIETTAQAPLNWALIDEGEGECVTDNRQNVTAPGGVPEPQIFPKSVDFPYIFSDIRGRGFAKLKIDIWDLVTELPHDPDLPNPWFRKIAGLGIQYQMQPRGNTKEWQTKGYSPVSIFRHGPIDGNFTSTRVNNISPQMMQLAFGVNNVSNVKAHGSVTWHSPFVQGGGIVWSTGVHHHERTTLQDVLQREKSVGVCRNEPRSPVGFRFVLGGAAGDTVPFVLEPLWRCTFRFRIFAMQ